MTIWGLKVTSNEVQESQTKTAALRLPKPLRIAEQVWPDGTAPLVTIRCITYNHVNFIRDAIEGFLSQETTFPVQVLIHDDASNDGTSVVLRNYQRKYPNLIKVIIQKTNIYSRGKKPGRFLRSLVQGKYIAFCDGDDYWADPSKLQKQVMFLERNPDYIMTYHDTKVVNENGTVLEEAQLPDFYKRDASQWELITTFFWVKTLTLCCRNVTLEDCLEQSMVLNGDAFRTSRLGHYGKGKWQGDVIKPGVYRVHQGGIWSALSEEAKTANHLNTAYWLCVYYAKRGQLPYAHAWLEHVRYLVEQTGRNLTLGGLHDSEQTAELRREINSLRASYSYRLGRLVLAPVEKLLGLPLKIIASVRCFMLRQTQTNLKASPDTANISDRRQL